MRKRNWTTWNELAAVLLLCGNSLFHFIDSDISRAMRKLDSENESSTNDSEIIRQRATYRHLGDAISNRTYQQKWVYQSSFDLAISVSKAPWFEPRRLCKKTCCVETVAVSLGQDDYKPINWRTDHQDLADIRIQKFVNDDVSVFAQNFNEAVVPCLLPGTIIALDNYEDVVQYFWFQIRPKIRVPYILITGGSDSQAPIANPSFLPDYIRDPLLIQWYASNPNYAIESEVFRDLRHAKFQPILTGLSYFHPQHRYLMAYLELTNFTNPFQSMERWSMNATDIDFDRDIFVHFGMKHRPRRRPIWDALCGNNNTSVPNRVSCNHNTDTIPLHRMYQEMSTAKFGVSPPGKGYDCYRHYELLLLGVIPIVWEKYPESHDLYEGLPVIQMPNMDQARSRQDYILFIEEYIQSDTFVNATQSFAAGWDKLFLRYKRRAVLEKSGRVREIVLDSNGGEYYQGYRYSPDNRDKAIYCHNADENCALRRDAVKDDTWLDTDMGARVDQQWIDLWNEVKANS